MPKTWLQVIKLGKQQVFSMLADRNIEVLPTVKHYFKLCSLLWRAIKQESLALVEAIEFAPEQAIANSELNTMYTEARQNLAKRQELLKSHCSKLTNIADIEAIRQISYSDQRITNALLKAIANA